MSSIHSLSMHQVAQSYQNILAQYQQTFSHSYDHQAQVGEHSDILEAQSDLEPSNLLDQKGSLNSYCVGPFKQILTLRDLPLRGPLKDQQLEIIHDAGLWIEQGVIRQIFPWNDLEHIQKQHPTLFIIHLSADYVLTPGLVDAHTHLCYAGKRARDYADRLNGVSYQEITARGGGIRDSMRATREASLSQLRNENIPRLFRHLSHGVTTVEIKSGYGLSVDSELKQLQAIQSMQAYTPQTLIATCLAAHVLPPEFTEHDAYLQHIIHDLLPHVQQQNLSKRIDIFVEPDAFDVHYARSYLQQAQRMGFDLCVHADQFVAGGMLLAAELNARSADHLEATDIKDLPRMSQSDCVAVALPGASLGLGCALTPARQILDHGISLAIASDWNPGSAPMGHLLLQASVLGAHQKLSAAEVWAGMCIRAAHALGVSGHIGSIQVGYQADLLAFATDDYRDILYYQGMQLPCYVACQGQWWTN